MISKFALILLLFNNTCILIQSISNLHVWYEWLRLFSHCVVCLTQNVMSLLEVYILYKRGIYSNVCDQNNSVNNSVQLFVSYMQVWYRLDKYIIKNKQNQCKFWYHRSLLLLSQPPSPALRLLLLKKFGSKSLNYHWNISKNCIWDNMGVEGPR